MLRLPPPAGLAGLLLLIAALLYLGRMARFAVGVGRLRRGETGPLADLDYAARPRLSVIVASRDEAARLPALLSSLADQSYPEESFEVVIADDRSGDATSDLLAELRPRWGDRLKTVRIEEVPEGWTGKKWALRTAIQAATGEILVATDADCVVPPAWLARIAAAMEGGEGLDLLGGPVDYLGAGSWHWPRRLLRTEFFMLSLVGAGSIADGRPLLISGQNMAFRRTLHEEVGSEELAPAIPSGDDIFLLYAAHRREARIGALLHPDAVVRTSPPTSAARFLRQRARWSSKGPRYPADPLYFSLLTWVLHAGLLAGILLAAAGVTALWGFLAGAAAAKGVGDLALLREAGAFGFRGVLADYLTGWPLHLVYVAFSGLSGLAGRTDWS